MVSRQEDSGWPKRRTLRLRGYDYSQAGAYAVTICTHGGAFLFGQVSDGTMELSGAGRLVEAVWDGLPAYYRQVTLNAFVVMPDHVHGVIVFKDRPLPAELESEVGPAPEGASVGSRPEDGRVGDAAPAPEGVSVGSRPEDGRVGDAAPAPEGVSVGSRPEDGRVGDAAPAPEGVSVGSRPEDGRVRDAAPTKRRASRRRGLSEVVRGFKSMSGRRVNALRGTPGVAVWQRGFYEHVVRNEEDLNRIRQYIEKNPVRWRLKREGEERGLGAGESG